MAAVDNIRFPIPAASLEQPHAAELIIRRSRFLALGCHCQSRDCARDFVAAARARYPDATHHCWAFAAGAPGSTSLIGFADDGEPHGTAGRPILNVLLHCGFGQICVVVCRWFGGIKLGAGGLVRAYQEAALKNIDSMPKALAVRQEGWNAILDYNHLDSAKRLFAELEVKVEDENYGQKIELRLQVPEDKAQELEKSLANLTSGQASILRMPEQA